MDTSFRIQSIIPQVPAALKSNELDQHPEQEFIQLMVAQLQNQDPDKPTDGTALISQMVQMNSAIAMQRMSYLTTQNHAVDTAAALLGRDVMVNDPDTGARINGKVSSVDYTKENPTVTVNGVEYPVNSVQRVEM